MGSGLFFCLILTCAAHELLAFNCTECDKSKCPPRPISCPGRTATDPCGCCNHCAKQMWEPCGGENWELGYCDLRYRCAAVNGTGNVEIPDIGICKYGEVSFNYWMDDDENCPPVHGCVVRMSFCECTTIRTCVDYFSYSDEPTCRKSRPYDWEYFENPSAFETDIQYCFNAGCNLVEGRCECGSGNCEAKYMFRDQKECNAVLVSLKCANVTCPELPEVKCSNDSVITPTYTPFGECCPTVPRFCTCDFDKCPKCLYAERKITYRNATGFPGDCCDLFYCVPKQ
ncbi:cysteine-rich motor neuron 1 protein-like [Rhinatrema bivittatum]|uniref:cysteine-rich motor neuron 1 protein-like n=1 Tax=Rhinatrema bivittatum TaxID=194408 RepID=UPI00112DD321|nr:cysteine-rich motor neuron 1 protein-like [Rhinatrema bivittatum]